MEQGRRPTVLLFGNGPLRAFGGESWDEFLASMRRREDLPEGVEFVKKIKCPEPLKAIIITGDDVDHAMEEKCEDLLRRPLIGEELYKMLCRFLSVGFDHIITTNYTYEIENVLTYPRPITMRRLRSISRGSARAKGHKHLVHSYNSVSFGGVENKVWHIHGELSRPSSTVIGHYYYGNMLFRIKEEADRVSKSERLSEQEQNWVEAFLYGDIYCVGFGFGLSELDMWWLLNRKAREARNTGKLYFYDPTPAGYNEKRDLLSQLRSRSTGEPIVEMLDLGFSLSKEGEGKQIENGDFRDFYAAVIEDLKTRIVH